jgi:hypothetical protein
MFHTFRCCFWALVAVSLVFCCGCSGGTPYKVVPIEGTITYKGKPLEKVSLTFVVGDYRTSGAFVQAGGKFKAVHSPEKLGIPVGKCTLKLGWGGGDFTSPPAEYAELFAKYGMDSSGYAFEITKADKDFKIDLD